MSGPMSLREARTKQQKEKSYKNSRLRFRASMKPTRNERSPSEHGDEKSTRRKKIMKIDNTEGETSDANVGGSETEEQKVAISSDVDMSGGSGEIVEKQGTSANPDVKETGDAESDNMSIEKALEIVCGEAEPDAKLPNTEDEGSEDSLMPDEGNKEESTAAADEGIIKKTEKVGPDAGDTTKISPLEGGTKKSDHPSSKDGGDDKKEKKDNKKKRPRKEDGDSDDEDEDGKKLEKGKKKDKDGDGSGGSDKPDGGNGNDKDDDANGGDKSAGGENKDDNEKDKDNDQKGGDGGENSDDDFDMGGNGDEDKNVSDDDLDDLGGSSEDGASFNEGSDIEETEHSVEGETEFAITDDEESEADSTPGTGIGKNNIPEQGTGGIILDRGEGRGRKREEIKTTTTEEVEKRSDVDIAIATDPYAVESDVECDDDASADEDFGDYLSGGSGCEDENSYHGDDDYFEDVEEVRGTG